MKTGPVPDGFHAGLLSPRLQSPLSHNEFVRFNVETPARHRRGMDVIEVGEIGFELLRAALAARFDVIRRPSEVGEPSVARRLPNLLAITYS